MIRITVICATLAALSVSNARGEHLQADLSAITLRDPSGAQSVLADMVEGPAIVHFWATWCAPCLRELPELDTYAQGLEPGELVVVSVDTAEYERVETYLDALGVSFVSHQQIAGNAGSVFGILGYPSTVVVDSVGTVLWRRQGAVNWADADLVREIDALL